MVVKVKYIRDIAPVEQHGDWIDLRAGTDIRMMPDEYRQIPLGIAVELPEGYEAIIAARSSLFKLFGVLPAGGIGVIDNGYCGDGDEWQWPVYSTRYCKIPKGTRICQFRILRNQPDLTIETVENLSHENRGGLGSTGV